MRPPNITKKCTVIVTKINWFLKLASNGGGGGKGSTLTSSQQKIQKIANKSPVEEPPSNLTASSDSNPTTHRDFDFNYVHEKFGREIEQDLRERRRLKELAKQPLIQF